ncbi:MAG: hypothetical protein M1824_000445 [Vezdaea acicularis]|nr:MAG: hypothetical protein M1824_000445 [Vezdaea acicularis]
MGKRKRENDRQETSFNGTNGHTKDAKETASALSTANPTDSSTTIQIITGSYERILHGITAHIPSLTSAPQPQPESTQDGHSPSVYFSNTFLFNAHTSSIRSLALSPPSPTNETLYLASGGTDERINIYQLSLSPSPTDPTNAPKTLSLTKSPVVENPQNRDLGSLLHHSSSVSALYFPTRSKLISAAEDNTIAVTRTRDWTVLSTIKAPTPKAHGRPSGDTAVAGATPAGINDFAVHPSMKLMVSVGRGEKCMRLWNLVTGKKAGVLNFGRDTLTGVGEGRWGKGEGQRVEWGKGGEEFTVVFDKGAVVFGIDSKPRGRISPWPRTKLHQVHYVALPVTKGRGEEEAEELLAVSTEDGRVIFYTTRTPNVVEIDGSAEAHIPDCEPVAQLGGLTADEEMTGRIKDFEILHAHESEQLVVVTGGSDGMVRLWALAASELRKEEAPTPKNSSKKAKIPNGAAKEEEIARTGTTTQVGRLLGSFPSGNRITCLKAFVMNAPVEADAGAEPEEEVFEGFEVGSGSKSSLSSDGGS